MIFADAVQSFSLFTVGPGAKPPITHQWEHDGGGFYHEPVNWTDGDVPNDVDAVANFLDSIKGASTVTVDKDKPVTVGTINFSSAERYKIAGPGEITFKTSKGAPSKINVLLGDHTISAPLSFSSVTVDTSPGTSLTLAQSGDVTGGLTKTGDGTLVLPAGFDIEGALTASAGTVHTGLGVLAALGGPVTLGNGAVLEASGMINRLVYGDLSTQIVPTDNLLIGDTSGGGYTYGGQVQTGPYSVTLVEFSFPKKDATGTKVEGGAKIPGAVLGGPTAELSSTNGMHLLGVDWGNMQKTMLTGEGTVHNWVAAGDPVGGLGWIEPGTGNKITFTGNLQGSYAIVGDVEVLGQEFPSWSPGPSYNFLRPTIGALTLNVAGSLMPYIPLEVDPSAAPIVTDLAEGYSVAFVSGGNPATGETLLNGLITMRLDPDEVGAGNPYEFQPGDEFYLVWSGPAMLSGSPLDAAVLTYGPGFGLDLPDLTPFGLEWLPSELTEQYVKVSIVPEPSTLLLLAAAALALLACAWQTRPWG